MFEFMQNQKAKIRFKVIVTGLITLLAIAGIGYYSNKKTQEKSIKGGVVAYFNINLPKKYSKPLVIRSLGGVFAIQPVKAQSSDRINEGENKVKYKDAYPSTDVVQTISRNKIKEDIILKNPGHPEEFKYKLSLEKYDVLRNAINDFIFYAKGHKGDRLYRLFTIPAPFMWDSAGKVSNNREVETILTDDGYLTLKPSKEWLKNATYPVTIDPTVEINVLNVQSYPTVGGPWEVRFTTQGTEDLMVTGMSHDDYHTIFNDNIEFYSLKCGDEIRQPEFDKATNSYVYKNWQCNEVAYFTDTVLKPGKHHLQFNFGGQIADAYNSATGFTDPTSNGTGANFSDPTNAFVSDDAYAVGTDSYILDVDTFGFSINSTSIDGIEVRLEWRVNSGTYNLSCQLLDATGTVTGITKTTADNSSTTDITETLGSSSDMWGTTLTEADIEDPDFGVRCTAHKVSGLALSAAGVDNIDMQITYTAASNSAPTITSVRDYPDPVSQADDVFFSVDWNDVDVGENIKVKVCKSNVLSNQNCSGGSWASSTAFTTVDPETVSYTTASESGPQSYYVFVCDDEAACSSSTSGTFTVHAAGAIPVKFRGGTIKLRSGRIKIR